MRQHVAPDDLQPGVDEGALGERALRIIEPLHLDAGLHQVSFVVRLLGDLDDRVRVVPLQLFYVRLDAVQVRKAGYHELEFFVLYERGQGAQHHHDFPARLEERPEVIFTGRVLRHLHFPAVTNEL